MKFTAKQIADYRAYEKVRGLGRYNMLDRRAIKATGLTDDERFFVMRHYVTLRAEANKDGKTKASA